MNTGKVNWRGKHRSIVQQSESRRVLQKPPQAEPLLSKWQDKKKKRVLDMKNWKASNPDMIHTQWIKKYTCTL